MPRKASGAVRADLPRRPRPDEWNRGRNPARVATGLSATAQRQVADDERRHLRRGGIAEALAAWSTHVHGPRGRIAGPHSGDHDLCCPDSAADSRSVLERALRRLPPRAAREIRALLAPLDAVYLARVRPSPEDGRPDWWTCLR